MSCAAVVYRVFLSTRRRQMAVGVAILVLTAGLMAGAWLLRDAVPEAGGLGYLGIFLIGVLSAASMVVLPSPTLATICVGGTLLGLNPVVVGVAAGAGEALGEMVGYLLGLFGQTLLQKGKIYLRLYGWVQRRGSLALFLLALIPNPVFDIAGMAAGALRFPVYKFLLWVWAGKTLRDVGIASACVLGASHIPGLL